MKRNTFFFLTLFHSTVQTYIVPFLYSLDKEKL